jgi:hypothetical protein
LNREPSALFFYLCIIFRFTNIARVPDDYEAMGLQTNLRSLHFAQADGYVYAVDK